MNSSFLRAIFVTALKDTASKHGLKTDVLTKDFRLYIKVCVVLGKSQTQTCADLHTANPLAAPPTNIVFWWLSHFPDGNSRVQDIKGKMKTKTRYKTEMILITSKPNQKSLSLPFSVDLNGTSIHLSSSVNLGVTLDQNISFQQHVSRTCQICYFELRRISSIRHYLSQDALKTLISTFVLSRIDYCDSLLTGCPKQLIHKLQKVQNNAARLIGRTPKLHHISPVLHWLPVEQRIEYKLLFLAFPMKVHHICPTSWSSTYSFLTALLFLTPVSFTFLHSAWNPLDNRYSLVRPLSQETLSLPNSLHHSNSTSAIKYALKMHLFPPW